MPRPTTASPHIPSASRPGYARCGRPLDGSEGDSGPCAGCARQRASYRVLHEARGDDGYVGLCGADLSAGTIRETDRRPRGYVEGREVTPCATCQSALAGRARAAERKANAAKKRAESRRAARKAAAAANRSPARGEVSRGMDRSFAAWLEEDAP